MTVPDVLWELALAFTTRKFCVKILASFALPVLDADPMRTAIPLAILVAPLLTTSAAALLYVMQGGFGGGHGPYDQWIYWLGLPALFLLGELPSRWLLDWAWQPVWLILLPGCLNFVLLAPLAAITHRLLRGPNLRVE